MYRTITKILGFLLLISSAGSLAYDPQYNIHGVRSSFLIKHYTESGIGPGARTNATMYYLGREWSDADRAALRAIVKANGDTHIDLYTRSEPRRGGHVVEGHNFTQRLKELNDAGLKPVLWLTPESKHGEHGGTVAEQKAYMGGIVDKYDDQVAAYVVCLECDDYWSPSQVSALIKHIKSKSGKPVAVHLTPGVGGGRFKSTAYYKDADYIYLQVGGHTKTGYKTADIQRGIRDLKEALKLGKPVVVSEYSMYSTSAEAKRFGDVMCQNGAVGTGNGRNITACGQTVYVPPPSEDSGNNDIAKLLGIAAVAIGAYYLYSNYDFELLFNATQDYQSYGATKSFKLTEKSKLSLNLERYENEYSDDNTLMLRYKYSF